MRRLGAQHAPQLRRAGRRRGLLGLPLGDLHVREDASETADEARVLGFTAVGRRLEGAAAAGTHITIEVAVDAEVACERMQAVLHLLHIWRRVECVVGKGQGKG